MVTARVVRLLAVSFALVVVALGCGGPAEDVAYPKVDGNPPPRTSDGQVVGADGQSPERALAEQPTNLHPAPGPDAGTGDIPR